ncbi:hypothetical protein E2C01_040976 [Portunus trituberculatus]|uniref:Uncharacterized protein n=1 Tax=Portunus trituberculatus TaxID=210409 RepID=A0A5B7FP17_PORTR|nr:hypothetical protein [Portunus trituberculatus]
MRRQTDRRLAQCALEDATVDPGPEHPLGCVKSAIKDFVHSSISDQLELWCHRGCGTSVHYACVSQSCVDTYGDTLHHMTGQDDGASGGAGGHGLLLRAGGGEGAATP